MTLKIVVNNVAIVQNVMIALIQVEHKYDIVPYLRNSLQKSGYLIRVQKSSRQT